MVKNRNTGASFPPVEEVNEKVARNLDCSDLVAHFRKEKNRVKTRFLGFSVNSSLEDSEQSEVCQAPDEEPAEHAPLARLVIVKGAGRGTSFVLSENYYRIGRDAGQEVQLAFGDKFVSGKNHATIAHYGERYGFEIRDGGKANPVLLNGRRLWRSESLKNGDLIRLGTTTLVFFDLRNEIEANIPDCPMATPNPASQIGGS